MSSGSRGAFAICAFFLGPRHGCPAAGLLPLRRLGGRLGLLTLVLIAELLIRGGDLVVARRREYPGCSSSSCE